VFDVRWNEKFLSQPWGMYPNEELVRFAFRTLLNGENPSVDTKLVLDLGCGAGSNSWFLAKEGLTVFGLDGSVQALIQARTVLERFGVLGSLTLGDVCDLPFAAETFDAVIDVSAIQHNKLSDVGSIFSEVKRVLKPGGFLFSFCLSSETTIRSQQEALEVGTYWSAPPYSIDVLTHFFVKEEVLSFWGDSGPISIQKIGRWASDSDDFLSHLIVTARKEFLRI
jgi:ubiquinone/menaquinone biosynthesis C-methylase UbiE